MSGMITDVDEYFRNGCGRCARFATSDCSARMWSEGQTALRAICLDVGLEETAKWGHPCYMHAGRNIDIMGAFRDNFRLTFFNAALLKDPERILQKQGENTHVPDMIRFSEAAQVAELEPTLRAYLAEAMGYAEQGIKPPKISREVAWPEELAEALDADPELAEAFHALTPGRQKSYAINLNGAKKSETRVARIEKFRPRILAGKGALEL